MSRFEMVKGTAQLLVSIGVGTIVTNAITSTTPKNMGKIAKICIGIGGFVLGAMATEKATEYVEKEIDSTMTDIKKMMNIEE